MIESWLCRLNGKQCAIGKDRARYCTALDRISGIFSRRNTNARELNGFHVGRKFQIKSANSPLFLSWTIPDAIIIIIGGGEKNFFPRESLTRIFDRDI